MQFPAFLTTEKTIIEKWLNHIIYEPVPLYEDTNLNTLVIETWLSDKNASIHSHWTIIKKNIGKVFTFNQLSENENIIFVRKTNMMKQVISMIKYFLLFSV